MDKKDDLISIALWAAHRLPTKRQKKYVYEELLKNIGDEHDYSEFINKELDLLVVGYDTKAYRKVANDYYGG